MNASPPTEHPALAIEQAAHWHALQRAGELDERQQAQFMDWLLASPRHLREYMVIQRIAGELADALHSMDVDLDTLQAPAPDNVVRLPVAVTPPRARPRRHARALACAATLACMALLAGWLWPQTREYTTGAGTPASFVLADGSRVHLAGGSTLVVRLGPLRRNLELRGGQASFDVAEDRRRFRVHVADMRVEDIGTIFDVALLDGHVRVDVVEGRVQVWPARTTIDAPLADISAGHRVRIDRRDHSTVVTDEDPRDMTAWWTGRLVFDDEPLSEVAERFNRLNHVQLSVRDPAIAGLRLTGNLRASDIEVLLAYLHDQPGLQVQRVDGQLHVHGGVAEQDHL